VLDRASTFSDRDVVQLLRTRFIPVAIDQAYQRRQQDAEGEFYRKIASQGPRKNFEDTTQGFYIVTPSGDLLLYNNNRDPEKVGRLMKEKLQEFRSHADAQSAIEPIEAGVLDARFHPPLPEGGLVVRVRSKVLGGYAPTDDRWQKIFQAALSRDNLWISKAEHEALVRGQVATSLQQRIARFHLVDNTRGEPTMWEPEDIHKIRMNLRDGQLTGEVLLETKEGDRGYTAEWKGNVKVVNGKVVRFDWVALGEFWGEGPFTRGAPEGKFPLAVSFTLADGSDLADEIPPQASRGWIEGYLR
jgi:hypothetical protein